ncbi:hypothetical protein [Rhodoplanes sp. SY1]|uniref:hypothetical protein n=1 Tax=Rhodoplanes sp. SY1 TaxID=3166646 RepID=UPI0038B4A801
MATYQIRFFKRLLSSDGHPFCCLQDRLEVRNADTPECAVARAERRYERLKNVSQWDRWADVVEVSEVVRRSPARRRIGGRAG